MDVHRFFASSYALLARRTGSVGSADEYLGTLADKLEELDIAHLRKVNPTVGRTMITEKQKKETLATMAAMGGPAPRRKKN